MGNQHPLLGSGYAQHLEVRQPFQGHSFSSLKVHAWLASQHSGHYGSPKIPIGLKPDAQSRLTPWL